MPTYLVEVEEEGSYVVGAQHMVLAIERFKAWYALEHADDELPTITNVWLANERDPIGDVICLP